MQLHIVQALKESNKSEKALKDVLFPECCESTRNKNFYNLKQGKIKSISFEHLAIIRSFFGKKIFVDVVMKDII